MIDHLSGLNQYYKQRIKCPAHRHNPVPQLSLNDPFNPQKCHNHTLLNDILAMVVKGLLVHNILTYKFICYSAFLHTNLFAVQHSYIQINLLFSILTYKFICYSTFLHTNLLAIQHFYFTNLFAIQHSCIGILCEAV